MSDIQQIEGNETQHEKDQALLIAASTVDTPDVLGVIAAALERGANPNVKDSDGMTPLMHVYSNWLGIYRSVTDDIFLRTVDKLLRSGANINDVDNEGKTVLAQMLEESSAKYQSLAKIAIEKLIEEKADVNTRDNDGMTPLMLACNIPNFDDEERGIIDLLLANGADIALNVDLKKLDDSWLNRLVLNTGNVQVHKKSAVIVRKILKLPGVERFIYSYNDDSEVLFGYNAFGYSVINENYKSATMLLSYYGFDLLFDSLGPRTEDLSRGSIMYDFAKMLRATEDNDLDRKDALLMALATKLSEAPTGAREDLSKRLTEKEYEAIVEYRNEKARGLLLYLWFSKRKNVPSMLIEIIFDFYFGLGWKVFKEVKKIVARLDALKNKKNMATQTEFLSRAKVEILKEGTESCEATAKEESTAITPPAPKREKVGPAEEIALNEQNPPPVPTARSKRLRP